MIAFAFTISELHKKVLYKVFTVQLKSIIERLKYGGHMNIRWVLQTYLVQLFEKSIWKTCISQQKCLCFVSWLWVRFEIYTYKLSPRQLHIILLILREKPLNAKKKYKKKLFHIKRHFLDIKIHFVIKAVTGGTTYHWMYDTINPIVWKQCEDLFWNMSECRTHVLEYLIIMDR